MQAVRTGFDVPFPLLALQHWARRFGMRRNWSRASAASTPINRGSLGLYLPDRTNHRSRRFPPLPGNYELLRSHWICVDRERAGQGVHHFNRLGTGFEPGAGRGSSLCPAQPGSLRQCNADHSLNGLRSQRSGLKGRGPFGLPNTTAHSPKPPPNKRLLLPGRERLSRRGVAFTLVCGGCGTPRSRSAGR